LIGSIDIYLPDKLHSLFEDGTISPKTGIDNNIDTVQRIKRAIN